MSYLLVDDAGYRVYTSAVAVRRDDVTLKGPCLSALVPLMQKAQVDYMENPAPANAAMLKVNGQLKNPWVISSAVNDYGDRMMRELGIVANGPDGTLGSFDLGRIEGFLKEAKPIFETGGKVQIPATLTAEAIATNRFIDKSIGLPK